MPGITAEALNDLLKRYDAFAIVKLHQLIPLEKSIELSNLAVVDDRWLRDRGLTLYELLGQMDVLVTDVSSVVVDYLILDRPVIHSFPDFAEYESSRGFSFNPVTDYLVGPMAVNADELFNCLSRVLQGEDSHAAQRKRMRQLFHKYADGDSTNRLLKHLKLLPK
jgi:CDP-glycerol glycerophosphotransferase (TagB/SpsB family)